MWFEHFSTVVGEVKLIYIKCLVSANASYFITSSYVLCKILICKVAVILK